MLESLDLGIKSVNDGVNKINKINESKSNSLKVQPRLHITIKFLT